MRMLLIRLTCAGIWCVACLATLCAAEPRTFLTLEAAVADPEFALQGEYTAERLGVQVVSHGEGRFLVVVYTGGLPGAGWNGTDKHESEEDAAYVRDLIQDRGLKHITRSSPTLGAKPPAGATILFDGSEQSLRQHWQAGAKQDQIGLLPGPVSLDQFADFSLHLEFRLPYMPAARGQERANSGVYLQGRHEVQVLDSFGLAGLDNECGALYGSKAPDLNACLPPLQWQTYDVEFNAARRNAAGKQIAPARVTVRHNGIIVHRDMALPEATDVPAGRDIDLGPILLQDHGNPVRYRNIWVLPRDARLEARRPLVPGFERFFGQPGTDHVAGGRLLLGELNCLSCHLAHESLTGLVLPRQAPVLDEIGKYVHPEYLVRYLSDPHGTKPGTLMPDVLGQLPPEQRDAAVLALANFLASTGTVTERGSDMQSAARGATLFGEVGCLACHSIPDPTAAVSATSVPLADLPQKYTIASLATFLREPHKVRPAGRMPILLRDEREAVDVATYLVGPRDLKPRHPNLKYTIYHGSWANVPRFDDLKPVSSGQCAGFDLSRAGRGNDFGVRFTGLLKVPETGEYTFHLGSDDGSFLYIDGKKITDSDGIHPHTVNSGKAKLTPGFHPLVVDYTQGGGEATLTLEWEGPGVPRQDANRSLSLSEKPPEPEPEENDKPVFRFDAALVDQGRTLFANLGCAQCHTLKLGGERIQPASQSKPLAELRPGQGCLAAPVAGPAVASATPANTAEPAIRRWPQFDLNQNQREALEAALAAPPPAVPPSSRDQVTQTMTTFNCYACHARGGIGGPERDRNPLFLTSIHEMGDEARIPPPLDGVGDKLIPEWLQHVLQHGAKDRPYMRTHMPQFPAPAVTALAATFTALDQRTEAQLPALPEAEHRVKAVGRYLAGNKALGCVKCHTFGPHRVAGVQAIDLQTMTRRVRSDWFLRYMVDPQAYRPGTRMPTGFANGQASVKDVYDGQPGLQLAALWTFLKDGDKAGIPEGLIANVIELKPDTRPILYRNFLEGLSPRGIAVGYPEQAHLAWDANRCCLTLIWHGRFLDAGKHWEGRGPGNQSPLGDHVMKLEDTVPIATLESPSQAWPPQSPREAGYRFRGYQLDAAGRPRFQYAHPEFSVTDFPKPVAGSAGGGESGFVRTLTIRTTAPMPKVPLYFRAATGTIEQQPDGWFLVDGNVRLRLSGGKPVIRESNGRQELIVPVPFNSGVAEIVEEIAW